MEREGKKDAESLRIKSEDEVASKGMRLFLGCGERSQDGLNDTLPKAETESKFKSDDRTTGWTQEIPTPKGRLYDLSSGGKRRQEGGMIVQVRGQGNMMN